MKFYFLLLGFICLEYASFAQDNLRVYIGGNITNVDYHLITNQTGLDSSGLRRENVLLPNMGVDIDFKVSEKMTLSTGLGVNMMGSNKYLLNVTSIPNLRIDSKFRVGYLRIPLLLKYELFKNIKIFGGYSLNYSYRKNLNFFATVVGETVVNENIYNNFHHAALLGISFEHKAFRFDINYHKGLSKIWDTKDYYPDQRAFLTLGGLQFSIGYVFRDI